MLEAGRSKVAPCCFHPASDYSKRHWRLAFSVPPPDPDALLKEQTTVLFAMNGGRQWLARKALRLPTVIPIRAGHSHVTAPSAQKAPSSLISSLSCAPYKETSGNKTVHGEENERNDHLIDLYGGLHSAVSYGTTYVVRALRFKGHMRRKKTFLFKQPRWK